MSRNIAIDVARFIFAFFVVVIHVRLIGSRFILPFARCAVPFFFLVAGFFVYSNSPDKLSNRLMTNAKKWFILWLRYTVLLGVFAVLICVFQGESFTFSWSDAVDLFKNGVCKSLDVVSIKGNSFGISVLWFLHAGFWAFLFLWLIKSYIGKRFVTIAMILLLLVACATNSYYESIIVYRVFAVALPFVYLGMLLKKYNALILDISKRTIIILIFLFVLTLYAESFFYTSEVYFSTIPLTLLIVIYLIKTPDLFGIKMNIPVKVSMDIYLWHRLIYALLFGFFNLGLLKYVAAVVVFCITLLIFTVIRKFVLPVSKCVCGFWN